MRRPCLDLPQRPDQLAQRRARMRRSGNTFSEVEFYRMISEPRDVVSPMAHDLQRAQFLERKRTFLCIPPGKATLFAGLIAC